MWQTKEEKKAIIDWENMDNEEKFYYVMITTAWYVWQIIRFFVIFMVIFVGILMAFMKVNNNRKLD